MATDIMREVGEPEVIEVTNVAADKTAGQMIVVGNLACVHLHDQLSGATKCPVYIGGVEVEYAKLTTDDISPGAVLYYDDTNDWVTLVAGALKQCGIALTAAAATTTSVRVLLGGVRAIA